MRDNVTVSNLTLATRNQPEIHNRPLACSDTVSVPHGPCVDDVCGLFPPPADDTGHVPMRRKHANKRDRACVAPAG